MPWQCRAFQDGGRADPATKQVRRGMKQGCPTTGLLLALSIAREVIGIAESFFLDELSSLLRDLVRGLHLLLPVWDAGA